MSEDNNNNTLLLPTTTTTSTATATTGEAEEAGNCSQPYYNQPRFVNVAITAATSSSASFLLCLLGVLVILLFKKWQTFGQRMIAYLVAGTTLFSLATAVRRVDYDEEFTTAEQRFCIFTAFAVQSSSWLVIDAIVAITVYLFLGIICNRFTERFEVGYVVFIFAWPSIFSWIPFIHGLYGRAGAWCWIRLVDFEGGTCEIIKLGQALQLVMFHLPLLIILPSIIAAYLVMLCKLSRNRRHWKGISEQSTHERTTKLLTSETTYLLVYPIIYFFLTLPLVVTRVQSWIAPSSPLVPLWHITAISFNMHGAAISLAFLLEPDTRRRLTWTHLRAAIRNYNSKGGVAKFPVRECAEQSMTASSSAATHPWRQPAASFDHAPNCGGGDGRDELAYTQVTAEAVVPVGP